MRDQVGKGEGPLPSMCTGKEDEGARGVGASPEHTGFKSANVARAGARTADVAGIEAKAAES